MSDTCQRFTAVAGYLLGERMAAGGMGSVHLGLKTGALGFQRVVAIKRLHTHLAKDPEFAARFKDEIRLASRLTHTNIVQTLDVVETTGELMLVMECVEGETLSTLLSDTRAAGAVLPVEVAVAVVTQALHGLHAAHEALDDSGRCLNLVHRDFSPSNIMINRDGLVKVLDFGIAKAAFESHVTRTGHVCGKFAYISPEQVHGRALDRRADIFAAGIVLWEALTCDRLFGSAKVAEVAALRNIMRKRVPAPSEVRKGIEPILDRIVLRALERDPDKRFSSARDFALALEEAVPRASSSTLARALGDFCRPRMARKAAAIADFRRELTQRTSVTQIAEASPNDLAEAVSEPNELETRDVQGVVVGERRARSGARWNRLWLLAAGLFAASLGMVARRALSPSDGPRTLSATPIARARPSLTTIHAAAPLASASSLPAPLEEAQAEPTAPVPEISPAPRSASVRRAREGRTTARAAAAAPSPSPSPCTPPTYTDDEGIRHFKAGCI